MITKIKIPYLIISFKHFLNKKYSYQDYFLILGFLFLNSFYSSSQQISSSEPLKSISFGNHLHTGRDQVFFSSSDGEAGLILAGTTERDTTLTDVWIARLDQDINEKWSIRISGEKGLSYDYPLKMLTTPENEILIVVKQVIDLHTADMRVVKISTDGEILWDIFLVDSGDTEKIDPSVLNFFLDAEGNLNIAYQLSDVNEPLVELAKISSMGLLTESYNTSLFYNTEFNSIYPYKMLLRDNLYYAIYPVSETSPQFYLAKFNKDGSEVLNLDIELESAQALHSSFLEKTTTLTHDLNGDIIWVSAGDNFANHEGFSHSGLMITKILKDGNVDYTIKDDIYIDTYLLGYHIDSENNLLVVSNKRPTGTSEEVKLYFQKYSPDGQLLMEKSVDNVIGNIADFHKDSILVYSMDNQIVNYDEQFNLISSVQLNNQEVPYFFPKSLQVSDTNSLLIGTTAYSSYEGSDYLSRQDIIVKKADNTREIMSYTFSGDGTSKLSVNQIIKNPEGNYLISFNEKLGPDNLTKGGSRAPISYRILELSPDFEIIDERIVEDNLLEVIYNTNDYYDNGHFEFSVNESEKSITLLKDNIPQFTRKLEMTDTENFGVSIVDESGNFLIATSKSSAEGKLHKISITNDYNYIESGPAIINMIVLTNNKIFVYNSERNIDIYGNDLTELIKTDSPQSIEFPYLVEIDNYVLLHSTFDNIIKIFDQNGEYINDFQLQGELTSAPALLEENNTLVVTYSKGVAFPLESGLQWSRGIISRYEINIMEYIQSVITHDDADNDGVPDFRDDCLNTEEGAPVNDKGCASFYIPPDNFNIQVIDPSCPDKKGVLIIDAKKNYKYSAYINNIIYPFESNLRIESLEPGSYTLNIKIESEPEFEQTFYFAVKEITSLSGKMQLNKTASSNSVSVLIEKGTPPYQVYINGNLKDVFENNNFSVNVSQGDLMTITSQFLCQGKLSMKVNLGKTQIFPNPVSTVLNILTPNDVEKVKIDIYNSVGQLIKTKIYKTNQKSIKLDVGELDIGSYFVIIHLNEPETIQFLKL